MGFESRSGPFGNWIFEHPRPWNEPGKTKLGLPGTQIHRRSSRKGLEFGLGLETAIQNSKATQNTNPVNSPEGPYFSSKGLHELAMKFLLKEQWQTSSQRQCMNVRPKPHSLNMCLLPEGTV